MKEIKEQLELYKRVAAPPAQAQKKIAAGRLKGMTDIKPQWRILALTETYGLCGIGWYYEITDKVLKENKHNNEIACFVDINLYIKLDGEWSKPIVGTGGSMYVAQERSGEHVSDECFKMALTDAISVAAKSIGVASDIYMGYSDSKYQKPTTTKVESEFLTDDRFNKALDLVKKGNEAAKNSLKNFKLSPQQKETLRKESIEL